MRLIRVKQGLSQEKLAELAEIDRTYVSMIERGRRHPTLEVAQKIAYCLQMKLSEMIRRAEKRQT
jgi:transcriptional regulator with XRE-family HTH domain